MNKFTFIGVMLVAGIQFSCTEETSFSLENSVETDIIPYFERFQEEGNLRGRNINYEDKQITATFDLLSNSVTGQCTSYASGERNILFDAGFWDKADEMEKEFLVFHELGHCYLGRSHLNESAENGNCKSMMNSGEGDCRNVYNRLTRDGYLDELFSQ